MRLKSLDRLRGHPLFMFARLLAEAVPRTEDASVRQVLLLARHASKNASRTPGGCPQSVESAVLRAFECVAYPRRLFLAPNIPSVP